jgi:hypothetical protein|tara:strand:+ start:971 stop:1261 length:291 start_codon:yes stop_codon:yes gene_type:complete
MRDEDPIIEEDEPEADEPRTAEERARHYAALFHSADLIDKIIAGNMEGDSVEEQAATMLRNVKHLEVMLAHADWEDENLDEIQPAIDRGRQYLDVG